MSPQGSLGNLGAPPVSLSHYRNGGPGDQRPWRARGLRPAHEPGWDTTNHRSRQGIGTRATSEVSREGQGGSLSGAYYRRRWGTEAQRTHGREGDAGHHAAPDGPTGETLSSPTVTPKLQRIAAQATHDRRRVFTTLAHLIDEDFLREAYRQMRKAVLRESTG